MSRNKRCKVLISISKQKMTLLKNDKNILEYAISTSRFGIGNKAGSCKTPLGLHKICEKIGKDAPTAVKAPFSRKFPTTTLSTNTYNC